MGQEDVVDTAEQCDANARNTGGSVYTLRMKDIDLLDFSLAYRGLEGLAAEILDCDKTHELLLPLRMNPTGEDLIAWLNRRFIPHNRTHRDEIYRTMGLHADDIKGALDAGLALSLDDSYWVVPKGFSGSFEQYNFYANRFSEDVARSAFTGTVCESLVPAPTPELTTDGMLPKGWRRLEDGRVYLFKGGTSGYANMGNEPYSEYYAYQIATAMGLPAVEYGLAEWEGSIASTCALFTDKDTAFVPAGRLVRTGGLAAVLEFYRGLGSAFGDQMCSMLTFDALICNEDRHLGNFGVLQDVDTGTITGPAPIFDNGLALFCYGTSTDFEHLDLYAQTRTPAYPGLTHLGICKEVMGDVQREQLGRLHGFTFERHPRYNLPEERLCAIERQLQVRIAQIEAL